MPLVCSLTIDEKTIIQPNSSSSGYYIVNNSFTLDELEVNSTHATFINLDQNNNTIVIVNSTGQTIETLCTNVVNCSINQTNIIKNIQFKRTIIIAITPSTALTQGILFNILSSNTIGNPAINNSIGYYNITIDPSSTVSVDIYTNLSSVFDSGIYVNESSSTTSETSTFSTNTTITGSWTILGNSTYNCTALNDNANCWIRFFMDVALGVSSGNKNRTFSYCAIQNNANPVGLC